MQDKDASGAVQPSAESLARAIREIVAEAAHEAADEAGGEATSVIQQVPELVRGLVAEALEQNGVHLIPNELQAASDRFEAVAMRMSEMLSQHAESDRAHLKSTLETAVEDLKQEVSRAVLSLTQSLATANQRLARIDSAFGERITTLAEKLEVIEKSVEERVGATGRQLVEATSAAQQSVSTIGDQLGVLTHQMEAIEKAVENKVDAGTGAVRALDQKLATAGTAAFRGLDQKIEIFERTNRETADAIRGVRRQTLFLGIILLVAIAGFFAFAILEMGLLPANR